MVMRIKINGKIPAREVIASTFLPVAVEIIRTAGGKAPRNCSDWVSLTSSIALRNSSMAASLRRSASRNDSSSW